MNLENYLCRQLQIDIVSVFIFDTFMWRQQHVLVRCSVSDFDFDLIYCLQLSHTAKK